MDALIKLGWVAGVIGVLISVAGIGSRLAGAYWIGGFQSGTLLQAGVAAMVFGCFCFLAALVLRA